jgi:3-deoxy-D-manno-octulosonic-acid transferase
LELPWFHYLVRKQNIDILESARTFQIIKQAELRNTIWFHCASLGEFEQGRSLIEKIKENNPETSIALSFFRLPVMKLERTMSMLILFFISRLTAEKMLKSLSIC